jgi:hypothetical protein
MKIMKTMLTLITMITLMLCRRWRLVANDAETAMLANAAEGGSPFAILQDNSFVIPYGDFPHKQGLQKFDRVAANEMVATHSGMLNKLMSWARGEKASYPVYVGHPDLPGSKDADKRAYGWIENMSAEDDGLHLDVKWSDEGRKLVENAHFKFYSPLWWTKKVKGGIRPVGLKSMGLTNDPNIPVPALANETATEDLEKEEPRQEEEMMQEVPAVPVLSEVLAALGLAEDAAREVVMDKISSLLATAERMATAETDAETMKSEKEKAEADLSAANERATAAEAALQVAANHAVQAAVNAGRITPAEAEVKQAELLAANDFAGALQELGKMPAKVKTLSATGDLGNAKCRLVVAANDAGKARREERAQLVGNEFQNTNPSKSLGERKRIAWERARRKNPEAFGEKVKDSSGSAA